MASWKAITPSSRGAQRSSPNDSRNGSNSRALTALLESWVNDSRDGRFPGEAPVATPTKRRATPASSKPTAHNGSGHSDRKHKDLAAAAGRVRAAARGVDQDHPEVGGPWRSTRAQGFLD